MGLYNNNDGFYYPDQNLIKDIKQIAVRYKSTCAVTNQGEIHCWGGSHITLIDYTSFSGVKQIAVGNYHVAIVTKNNDIMYSRGTVSKKLIKLDFSARTSI